MRFSKQAAFLLFLQAGLSASITADWTRGSATVRSDGRPSRNLEEHGALENASTEVSEMFSTDGQDHEFHTYHVAKGKGYQKKSAKSLSGKIEHRPVAPETPDNATDAPTVSPPPHPTPPHPNPPYHHKSAKSRASKIEHRPFAPVIHENTTYVPTASPAPYPATKGRSPTAKAPSPYKMKKEKKDGGKGAREKKRYSQPTEYYYEDESEYYYQEHYPKDAKAPRGSKASKKNWYPIMPDDDHYDNSTLAPTEPKQAKNVVNDPEDYYADDEYYRDDEEYYVDMTDSDPTQSRESDPGYFNDDGGQIPDYEHDSEGSSTSSLEVLIPIASGLGVLIVCLGCFICFKKRRREISPAEFNVYEAKFHRRVEDDTVDGTADLSDARTFTFSEDGVDRRKQDLRNNRSHKNSSLDNELRQVMENIDEFEEVSLHEDDEENQRQWSTRNAKSSSQAKKPSPGAFRSFSDILTSAVPPIRENISHDDSTVSDIYIAAQDSKYDDSDSESQPKDEKNDVSKSHGEADAVDMSSEDQHHRAGESDKQSIVKSNTESNKVIDLTTFEQEAAASDTKEESEDAQKESKLTSETESDNADSPNTEEPSSTNNDQEDTTPAWMKKLRSKPKTSPPPPPAEKEDQGVPEWMRKYNEMKFEKADE